MIKIISPRHQVVVRKKKIEFDLVEDSGSGYSFDADDNWNVVFDSEYESIQRENYNMVKESPMYDGPFFRVETWSYMEPAKAICECKREISLTDEYYGASECPYCHRWHNMSGQTLRNPDEWYESPDEW